MHADPATSRERPSVVWDPPFVTGLSVESAAVFGAKLVDVLAETVLAESVLAETALGENALDDGVLADREVLVHG